MTVMRWRAGRGEVDRELGDRRAGFRQPGRPPRWPAGGCGDPGREGRPEPGPPWTRPVHGMCSAFGAAFPTTFGATRSLLGDLGIWIPRICRCRGWLRCWRGWPATPRAVGCGPGCAGLPRARLGDARRPPPLIRDVLGGQPGSGGTDATPRVLVSTCWTYVPVPVVRLHVGHPVGYIGTDVLSRFSRMRGFNVLHALGWTPLACRPSSTLFGPAYAAVTTESTASPTFVCSWPALWLGLRLAPAFSGTIDVGFYRWTQWIFLQIYHSWFDVGRSGPADRGAGRGARRRLRPVPDGRSWSDLTEAQRREVVDGQRLAYTDEVPVNWCPGLGTVLANEEVIDGKSEVGGFPMERAADAAMDAHYCVRRAADQRPGTARLARVAQGNAAQLDRQERWRGS